MKITVIGTGYVGLVAGACLADMGNNVICIDNNLEKLKLLEKGIIPIYEPGLEELVKVNFREQRLFFSSDIDNAVKVSEVCFIAVGTPQGEDGSADLQYVFEVAKQIAKSMNGYKVIVDKSTVPVGTAEKVSEIIKENTKYPFDVVSNPEFLKQGNAVEDFLYPDRVIIGSKSAEMTKYAANSFLATKISFMNEIANLCEKVGADAEMVRVGISTDSRIGNKFLFPGLGYGGSCFPKDVKALIKTASENDCEMEIIKAADGINKKQRQLFLDKIVNKFGENLAGKTFGVWGLAFKPKTNDMREAPSITIINSLLDMGAKVKAYDPKAMDTAKLYFKDKITYSQTSYDAIEGADALLLLTEWNEFRRPDMDKVKILLKQPVIFDGRNQYNAQHLKEMGFCYVQIGR